MILHRTTVMVDTHGRESRDDDVHQFDFAAYDGLEVPYDLEELYGTGGQYALDHM